jgi:hypothetical protein
LDGIWQCEVISASTGGWQYLQIDILWKITTKGKHVRVPKTVMLLWDFAHEMWEHRNSVLHNMKLEASRAMHEAEINDVMTKLYEKVETYSTNDRWYFDMPLALQLRKLLHS